MVEAADTTPHIVICRSGRVVGGRPKNLYFTATLVGDTLVGGILVGVTAGSGTVVACSFAVEPKYEVTLRLGSYVAAVKVVGRCKSIWFARARALPACLRVSTKGSPAGQGSAKGTEAYWYLSLMGTQPLMGTQIQDGR